MSQAKLSGFDLKVYMYTHIGYIKTWLQEDVSLKMETFQNGSHLSPKPFSVRCMYGGDGGDVTHERDEKWHTLLHYHLPACLISPGKFSLIKELENCMESWGSSG